MKVDFQNDICHGCFGAANDDCKYCLRRRKVEMNQNPKKNSEGYTDLTAYEGLKNIIREESDVQKEVSQLIYLMKRLAGLVGYDVVGRITVKHRGTGKVFK